MTKYIRSSNGSNWKSYQGIAQANIEYIVEGEFIIAKADQLVITYYHWVDLIDYPAYMRDIVVAKLAVLLSETVDAYSGSAAYAHKLLTSATQTVMMTEGNSLKGSS